MHTRSRMLWYSPLSVLGSPGLLLGSFLSGFLPLEFLSFVLGLLHSVPALYKKVKVFKAIRAPSAQSSLSLGGCPVPCLHTATPA